MDKFAEDLVGNVTSGQKWRKKKCEKCGRVLNKLIKDKEGFQVCGRCKNKGKVVLGGSYGIQVTLEQALNKTYTFHSYTNKKDGRRFIQMGFPIVLAGKKFKIVVVDDDEGEQK